jgi:dihydrofolate reductase
LKAEPGQHLLVYGSADLLNALHQHGLVDEYHLILAPVTVGQGKRLFAEGGELNQLQLLNTRPTSTGMLVLTYGREKA